MSETSSTQVGTPQAAGSEPDVGGDMEARLKHILEVCPKLTFSMLRVGVGTRFDGHLVRGILDEMVLKGELKHEVQSKQAPSGRMVTYDLYMLPTNPFDALK